MARRGHIGVRRSLALITVAGFAAAGCGSSSGVHVYGGPAAVGPASESPSAGASPEAACPWDSLDPHSSAGVAIDYVDFVHWNGRNYTSAQLRGPGADPHLGPTRLGDVVFTSRCSMSAYNDRTHQSPPPAEDRDTAFLTPGTPVYSVVGWSTECRLAANTDNGVTVYLADSNNPDRYAPAECALNPSASPPPPATATP